MTNEIDALLARVDDPALRHDLKTQFHRLRQKRQFGLVFEEHLPERVTLPQHPIRRGTKVVPRDDDGAKPRVVAAVNAGLATLQTDDGITEDVPTDSLVAIAEFGEPIYPGLRRLGSVDRGGDKPAHVVIKGENYHALEALQFTHAGKVDCVYIDPPYNTGARDWKYNNDYIDDSDSWRHSKWLAMMDRRLGLARALLVEDGVLIVTIDENELLHLGMLLESVFSTALLQLVTICINPGGASGVGFSRVEEYAFFVFLGEARPVETADDMLSADSTEKKPIRWEWLMRGGSSWYRSSRPNLCYPILLDDAGERILGVGPPFDGTDDEDRPHRVDGKLAAWPVRSDEKLGIWRVDGTKLAALARDGYAFVSRADPERGTWTIKYLLSGTLKEIDDGRIEVLGKTEHGQAVLRRTGEATRLAKTVWNRPRHNAGGVGGTHLLTAQLGERGLFSFPKSVYSTLDCLQVAIGDRPDATVLDFFGGSGTTLNAVALMNDIDEGARQSLIVTNNEVSADAASRLSTENHLPGSAEYEAEGIFERVTRPRCEAAVSGQRPDGLPAKGKYLSGKPYEEGFAENVEFVELTYLDAEDIELDMAFAGIAPLLWMRAGSRGPVIEERAPNGEPLPYAATDVYAVLFDPDQWRAFLEELPDTVATVFIVTDSASIFAGVAGELPDGLDVVRLYENYLTTFAINQGGRR